MTYEQQTQQTTSAAAIWSMVLGILGLTCLGCMAGVPAVICGHVALSHIKKSAGLLTGDGMAIAGLVMGYLSLAAMVLVVPILLAIAIPSFMTARETSKKNACIYNMRMIHDATASWAMAENKVAGDGVTEADIASYLKGGKLPVCPAGGVYTLGKVAEGPACSVHGALWDMSDGSDKSDKSDSDDNNENGD